MFRGNFNSCTSLPSQVDWCVFAVWEDLVLWAIGTPYLWYTWKAGTWPVSVQSLQSKSIQPSLVYKPLLNFIGMHVWLVESLLCTYVEDPYSCELSICFVFSGLSQVASNFSVPGLSLEEAHSVVYIIFV